MICFKILQLARRDSGDWTRCGILRPPNLKCIMYLVRRSTGQHRESKVRVQGQQVRQRAMQNVSYCTPSTTFSNPVFLGQKCIRLHSFTAFFLATLQVRTKEVTKKQKMVRNKQGRGHISPIILGWLCFEWIIEDLKKSRAPQSLDSSVILHKCKEIANMLWAAAATVTRRKKQEEKTSFSPRLRDFGSVM